MKKFQLFFIAITLFILPLSVGAAPIDEVKKYISQYYVGPTITDALQEASTIDEMIDLLDPYSDYFTADEMKQFTDSVNMTTIGIGIVIEEHVKGIYIKEVLAGGSAADAGIVAGDIITHVDGESIADMRVNDASAKIIGVENTKVTIKLLRKNGQSIVKTLTRKAFSVPNASSKMLYGNVGYISLNSFSEDAVTLMKNEIKSLSTQGATTFIFDLQNNTGGYVTSAEQIVGLFPGARNAYAYTDASGDYLIRAQRQSIQFPNNTRVLVNQMSASASEMTAAALKDQQLATLYGQKTYGKGSMQTFFPLSDGSYLKLTIAEFFGPNRTAIHQVGVKPDIQTEQALATAHFDTVIQTLPNYTALTPLKNVPTTKTVTLTFNKEITSVAENSIELVQLGNQKVGVNVTTANNKIVITPTETLISGESYLLLIHPQIKGIKSSVKKGSYLHITVK